MIINSYRTFQQDCKLVKEAGGDWWRVEVIPEKGGAGVETGSCVGLVSGGGEETLVILIIHHQLVLDW